MVFVPWSSPNQTQSNIGSSIKDKTYLSYVNKATMFMVVKSVTY